MATQSRSFFLLCLSTALLAQAKPSHLHRRDALPFPITAEPIHLHPRQAPENPGGSICGYRNGNLDRSWVAPEGSSCFLDHTASYFGWCNVLLTKAGDCSDVPRACVDSSTCSTGCGKTTDEPEAATITCSKASSYCYSNLLVTGDLTYTWLGCDLERTPLMYSPAAGILDLPSSAAATPTDSSKSDSSRTTSAGGPSTPTASGTSAPGTAVTSISPSQTADSQSNAASSSTPAPTTSSSSNTGAIAGGIVGGLAVLAMAGLGFYFIRRKTSKKNDHGEPAELSHPPVVQSPDYRETSSEKFAYHSELPGPIAAAELGAREPVELYGDTIPAEKKKKHDF